MSTLEKCRPETSGTDFLFMQRRIPEERDTQLHGKGNFKTQY